MTPFEVQIQVYLGVRSGAAPEGVFNGVLEPSERRIPGYPFQDPIKDTFRELSDLTP